MIQYRMKRMDIKVRPFPKISEAETTLGKTWAREGSSSTSKTTTQSFFGYSMK